MLISINLDTDKQHYYDIGYMKCGLFVAQFRIIANDNDIQTITNLMSNIWQEPVNDDEVIEYQYRMI